LGEPPLRPVGDPAEDEVVVLVPVPRDEGGSHGRDPRPVDVGLPEAYAERVARALSDALDPRVEAEEVALVDRFPLRLLDPEERLLEPGAVIGLLVPLAGLPELRPLLGPGGLVLAAHLVAERASGRGDDEEQEEASGGK